MPTPAARALTLQHQARLSALTGDLSRQVAQIAHGADGANIDRWFSSVLPQLLALVAAFFRTILGLTEQYLAEHGRANGQQVTPQPTRWITDQVLTSLRVTGPVAFKNSIKRGVSVEDAISAMAETLSASAQRLAAEASRRTIADTIDDDGQIEGWRRVGDADPCAFCAMLISRGAVYKTRESALGVVGRGGRPRGTREIGQSFHDGDQCDVEPLYVREEEPAEVQWLQDQWARVTRGHSGSDALTAWRKWWDDGGKDGYQPDLTAAMVPDASVEREAERRQAEQLEKSARDRQAVLDQARARAGFLAEVEAAIVIAENDRSDVFRRQVAQLANRFDVAGDTRLAEVIRIIDLTDDHASIAHAIEDAATAIGLTRIGGRVGDSLQLVVFNTDEHDMIPGERKPAPGTIMEVETPGYAFDLQGKRIVLVKARVDVATPADAAAFRSAQRPAVPVQAPDPVLQDMIAAVTRGDEVGRTKLYGGQTSVTELVTFPGGYRLVSKRADTEWSGMTAKEKRDQAKHEADAEQLVSLVGQAIGAPVPRVYRDKPGHVWIEYVNGASTDAITEQMRESRDAVLIGLLDVLTTNTDRNDGNLLGDGGRLVGIDHGSAYLELPAIPAMHPWINSYNPAEKQPTDFFLDRAEQWIGNPLTAADIDTLRVRLDALRPEFVAAGRASWHAYTMRVLDKLAEHANGDTSVLTESRPRSVADQGVKRSTAAPDRSPTPVSQLAGGAAGDREDLDPGIIKYRDFVRTALAGHSRLAGIENFLTFQMHRLTGHAPHVDLEGLALDTAREYVEAVLRSAALFRGVQVGQIGTFRETSREANNGGMYAYVVSPHPMTFFAEGRTQTAMTRAKIMFNTYFGDARGRSRLLASTKADEQAGWHPPGTGNPAAIAVHEYGHVVYDNSRDQEIRDLISARAAEEILKPNELIERDISRYAADSYKTPRGAAPGSTDYEVDEVVGEAFADVMVNGRGASNLSRAVVDIIGHAYRDVLDRDAAAKEAAQ